MIDILLNKAATIERCLKRINEDFPSDEKDFKYNYTIQDSVILNIQRAIHACVDMASIIIKNEKWEIPQTYRECFTILANHGCIEEEHSIRLQKMVSFRNIAVHDYQKLNLDIVIAISRII